MTHRARFTTAAIVFATLAIVEMVGGTLAHSVSLLSDGMHNLADALALGLGALALRVAVGTIPSDRMHFGWHRLEVLSALLNGVVLLAVALGVLLAAILRLGSREPVHVAVAVPLVALSLAANVVVALWLRPGAADLNQRAAYLHVLADAGWSAGLLLALCGVALTGRTWLDPVAAAVVALPVAWSAIGVVRSSGGILLQRTHVDPADVVQAMRAIAGVSDVPDLRLWHACSYLIVGTAHIVTPAIRLAETAAIARAVRELLENRFGIKHVTLEFESPEGATSHPHPPEMSHEEEIHHGAPHASGHAHP